MNEGSLRMNLYCMRNYDINFLVHNLKARGHQENWQPQRNRNFRELLSAWVEHMLLNGAAQTEETAPFSNMCSTQADNNSRKLRCGCQFP
jgi:hypothetical protein